MSERLIFAWGIPIYPEEMSDRELEEFEIFPDAWYTNTDGQVIWLYSHSVELDLWEMQAARQPLEISVDVTHAMQENLDTMLGQLPPELAKKVRALREPAWHIIADMDT